MARDSLDASTYGGGKAPLNNAIMDPMQGFDADVYVLDQATGSLILAGRFVSLQLTLRNSTEPYIELNQRIPRYLDGQMQIGWVLERGMLDANVLAQTFGYKAMTRQLRIDRMTRFQISFNVQAPALLETAITGGNGQPGSTGITGYERDVDGRYILTMCKPDSLTISAQAGQQVIANRWEGMAEGIQFETLANSALTAGTWLESTDATLNVEGALTADDNADPFPWDIS